MASTISSILASLTIVAQILTVFLLFIYFKERKNPGFHFQFMARRGMALAFVVSLVALLGSLTYSEILHYEPCKFCWWQRIFMYPQVLILGLALWKKDRSAILYSTWLSILGALTALNHYILQRTGTSVIPCSTLGQSAACNKVFVIMYGDITIPLMALSAFLLILVSMMFARRYGTTPQE